jgi:hypothetical protein
MEGALIKHFKYKVPILNFLLGVIMGVVSELQSVRSQFWAIFFFWHRNASTCQYFVFISGRKFMYMLDPTLENTVLSVFESGED